MSQPALSTPAAVVPPPPNPPAAPALHLVRLPVDKPQAAVAFLRARSRGVMDLIAHFWEGLAQTGPLQRGDFHLVGVLEDESSDKHINISTIDAGRLAGAMLYVPKAHRADVLALTSAAAGVLVSYICHLGCRAVRAAGGGAGATVEVGERADKTADWSQLVPVLGLTDLTGRQPVYEMLPVDPPTKSGTGWSNGTTGGNGSAGGGGSTHGPSTATNGTGNNGSMTNGGGIPIDFLTGEASAIAWMTPLLLPLVHKRHPARQLTNVVMQLPAEVPCGLHPQVRPAREGDVPTLNRWRRLYKEERGILFDADMDALIHNQRVFVYELPAEGGKNGAPREGIAAPAGAESTSTAMPAGPSSTVVAVAKIDLDLADLTEIGGVYTFPEHRQHGYSAALMGDMAWRIRQAGKRPTLQVDEANVPALRLYEKLGWQAMGKLSRVWLTG